MGNYVPLIDRLGFRRAWNSAYYALDAASTAIPAGQTIVVLNWCRHDKGALVATDHYVGVGASETGAGHRASMLRNGDTIKLGAYAGAWQLLSVPIPDDGDHLWALVVDRDNGQLEAWLDGVKVNSAPLTQNPTLTANNQILFNNSTGQLYSDTHWKGAVFSLTAAATPTAAEWAWIFKAIQNPEAPLPALLTGKIAAHNAMWRFGEGVYGSTTIVNERNPGTDDLTLQGGLAIQTARVRARTPWRRPRRTWYSLKPGYTGSTAATDFTFAVQPVVFRVPFSKIHPTIAHTGIEIIDAGATDYIRVENVGGATRVNVKGQTLALDREQADVGGDLVITADGTAVKVYLSGQQIGALTLGAALDFTGNCTISVDGRTNCGRIWIANPAVLPATIETDLRNVVNAADKAVAGLTALVDYSLDSEKLPLATSTTVANGGAVVSVLTLSAQRSTSCNIMLTGYDP